MNFHCSGIVIQASATTDKPVYIPGEVVNINVALVNNSSATMEVHPYPPTLDIIDTNGQAILTFEAGDGIQTLLPDEEVRFQFYWYTKETTTPGTYYLKPGSISYDSNSAQLKFSGPVSFDISP